MRRAQERGIQIPGDLSVVGVDDGDVRMHVWPRLTAVCQDASALGYEAAVWLTRTLSKGSNASSGMFRRTTATVFEVNGTAAAPRVVMSSPPAAERSKPSTRRRSAP
jgi:hypothetical protein